jgi:hypothetical protein
MSVSEDDAMIPRKIHYCWLSGDPMPGPAVECVNSWKSLMPDYELILWDQNRFDICSVKFVEEACRARKWAFAADYIRLYSIYHEGGIYLDSDVVVSKEFDEFLGNGFFSGIEYHSEHAAMTKSEGIIDDFGNARNDRFDIPGIGIQAAILGGVKGHPFLKECMEFYESRNFHGGNGDEFDQMIAPGIYAFHARSHGFRYVDETQYLTDDMVIFESSVFAANPGLETSNSFAVHGCAGSWRDEKKETPFGQLKIKLRAALRGG